MRRATLRIASATSTLPEAPRRMTLPPASLTVYEFDVL